MSFNKNNGIDRSLYGLFLALSLCLVDIVPDARAATPEALQKGEEVQIDSISPGTYGGTLVVGQRAEIKTLNPVLALDVPSREVIAQMRADLIHINRVTQKTEPALASSWKMSADGRSFTLKLRRGLRFSDGEPFDADDVVFTFKLYLDEKLHSSQRDLLVINGKPLSVAKLDAYTSSRTTVR